jgi:hypothetical protein
VAAIAIMLTLSLSIVANPSLFVIKAESASSAGEFLSVSETNTTAQQKPLGKAVLALDDATNILNTPPESDPLPEPTSTPTSSDIGADITTGETGSTTGETGSTTGDVEPSSGDPTTGDVEPSSGDPTTGDVEPSSGAPATGEGGSATNTTETAADVSSSAGISNNGTGSSVTPSTTEFAGASEVAELRSSEQSSTFATANSIDDNALSATSAESVTVSSAENPNSVQQPISTGDGQTVTIGDVSDNSGTSAHISLDRESYAPGDTAVITIQDPDADVDSNVVNTVQIVVGASISDPDGSIITLTETAPDSGIFVGTSLVPATGNDFRLNYDASHPQARAVINGVTQPGSVEVSELPVSSFEQVLGIGNGQPTTVVGNGIQVTYLDGAELALSPDCEAIGFQAGMGCGGSTQITISYANAPADLNELPPGSLTIWQFVPLAGWLDLNDFHGNIQIDPNAKTVTATSPFGPGVFVIGRGSGGGGGGGGSGAFPGAGIVLDLVAPIVSGNEPPASNSEPIATNQPEPVISNVVSSTEDTNNDNVSISTSQELGNAGQVRVGPEDSVIAKVSRNGNVTVPVPGVGNVTLSFTNLVSEDNLTVSTVKEPDLLSLGLIKDAKGQAKVMTVDNSSYSVGDYIIMIGPTDSEFRGTITATMPYDTTLGAQGSDVKMLYHTGSGWEDVTTGHSANGKVVTGSLSSLGAITPAVKS